MIKIAHIARPVAGVGVYIDLLVKNIDEKKFTNILLCNEKEEIIIPKTKSGKSIKLISVDLKREIKIFTDIKILISIIKILKTEKPNIVHCHSAKAGILGRLGALVLGYKTIYTPHAYSYLSSRHKIKRFIYLAIERFLGKTKALTLACSKSEYQRAIKDVKISKEKVYLWNNSIEIKKNIGDINFKLPDTFICTIGRPSYQKNTILLIKTILKVKENIPDIRLLVLGVGFYSPELNNLKKFISENGIEKNVLFLPWLERKEVLAILNKSLFYISTSIYEGLPYSVIEALSLSKACVLTKIDGHKDLVVDNYNGFLVNFEEIEISKKILELYYNKDLLSNMERKSFKVYNKFYNIEKNILKLEKIYYSIIN